MTRVKFTATRTTREAEPQTFEAGREYNLPPASAARWVRRGVAEIIEDVPAETPTEAPRPAINKGGRNARKGHNRANK